MGAGAEFDGLLSEMLQKQPSLRPAAADVAARLTGSATQTDAVVLVRPARTTVGQSHERADLRAAFTRSARGVGQFIAIAGEPGIGKSTLVADFLAEIETPVWIATGRCSERLAGAEARLPFLEALEGLMTRDPAVAALMNRCAPGWVAQIAPASAEIAAARRCGGRLRRPADAGDDRAAP